MMTTKKVGVNDSFFVTNSPKKQPKTPKVNKLL